jgi:hypothetical protein
VDHRGRRNEINGRPERDFAGEAMIGDVRAVEKGKIVGAVLDALEALFGIVKVELEPALTADERRADRAADIEIKAGGLPPVRRLADEPRTRNAAAADDAGRLDAIDDRAGVGKGARGENKSEREGEGEGDAEVARLSMLSIPTTTPSRAAMRLNPRPE